MKVEHSKSVRNWHKEVAVFFYPALNEVYTMGIAKRDLSLILKKNLVGFWKIKKV